jgi:hypothetical protein
MASRLLCGRFTARGLWFTFNMFAKSVPFTPKQIRYGLVALFIVLCCSLGFWTDSFVSPLSILSPAASLETPANSTLGFGALLAVSPASSPRRHGLLQAANVTEIEIIFPELPIFKDEDAQNFRAASTIEEKGLTNGMVFAWMSHLHVLKW